MSVTSLGRLTIAMIVAASPAISTSSAQSPDYRRSIAAIARRELVDDSVALPGARSIVLTVGGPTPRAILLLHGLTDSPRQFEALAYLLHVDGNNVYVPRLPQHGLRGGSVSSLSALTAEQLRAVGDSVVEEARGLGDSLIVVGLSMGGTMAAWITQQERVARSVLIAPAMEPGRIPSLLDRPLIGLADRLPSVAIPSRTPDDDRPDRQAGFNLRATAELFQLGESVLSAAARNPPSTHDIVVLVNAADRTVRQSASERLAGSWAKHGAAVAVLELPDSLRLPHNIIDPLRGRVGGLEVLALLRALVYGEPPTDLVRRLTPRPGPE